MKAALISGKRQLEFKDFPFPEQPEDNTVVVEITLCGICGSDVAAFRDGEGYPPFLSGHEWVGVVRAVGSSVAKLKVGDRVVAGTPPACGTCDMCLKGHHERCSSLMMLSFGTHPQTPTHGGYTQRIAVPANMLISVPDTVSNDQAVLVEPATVAVHAVLANPPGLNDLAVVIGGGAIGLFAAQALKLSGARVVVIEPRQRRRDVALELGADHAATPDEAKTLVDTLSGDIGADLVLDCVGNEAALKAAIALARPKGKIVMLGIATSDIKFSPLALASKELTLVTSLAHLNHEFSITMDLMADGRLKTEKLVEGRITLAQLEDTMNQLADGADILKVIVDPQVNQADAASK